MKVITLDFETYYSQQFSLSKMTTEEYIRSPEFEVIGVAVQVDDGEPVWFSGNKEKTKGFLDGLKLDENIVVAHNASFDCAILSWIFDIRPKRIVDTLSMARALHGTEVGGSLKVLAEHYGVGEKGTEVLNALGKRRIDFDAQSLQLYGEYCINDVALTYSIFNKMVGSFPITELRLIDLTIRMFTEPALELNRVLLAEHLTNVLKEKEQLMSVVDVDREELMSNDKFAEILKKFGVEPPTKISPKTGKEAWAFAKTDEEFKALLDHDNPSVQVLASARLGIKSTLEETRTERFIGIANRGLLPIPLRYYAAHTGRWGGDDKVNLQNLPRTSRLKYAIHAPDGYLMINSDSSQIEARTLAWLAEQNDLVDAFEKGEDVYKIMASSIYGKPVAEINKEQRFMGKTTILGCIAEGTLVLSNNGWKPIEKITFLDKLWDGENWVCHQGLVKKGLKKTLNVYGTWLTPDHKILCGTHWKETQSVVQDESTLFQALDTGAENLPLRAMLKGLGVGWHRLLYSAIVESPSTQWIRTTLKTLKVPDATYVLKKQAQKLLNRIGSTATYSKIIRIGEGFLTASQVVLQDAIQKLTKISRIMEEEEFLYMKNGEKISLSSYSTLYLSRIGMTHRETLTELTITKGTSRIIYGLLRGQRMRTTNEKSKYCSRNLMTYDIAFAGPRNRFTIATNAGPIIVHNCGYGMGAVKFRTQLKRDNIDLSEEEAKRIINTYRETYEWIPILWRQAGAALEAIMADQTAPLGTAGVLMVEGRNGIRLPNGLYIKYPNLRKQTNAEGKEEFVYDTKKGKATIPNRIYGGKVVENVCQALARIAIGDQMLQIAKKYKVVMTVHDSVVVIVPEDEIENAVEYVEMSMRLRPKWGMDLPLNCESGYGLTYGDC